MGSDCRTCPWRTVVHSLVEKTCPFYYSNLACSSDGFKPTAYLARVAKISHLVTRDGKCSQRSLWPASCYSQSAPILLNYSKLSGDVRAWSVGAKMTIIAFSVVSLHLLCHYPCYSSESKRQPFQFSSNHGASYDRRGFNTDCHQRTGIY